MDQVAAPRAASRGQPLKLATGARCARLPTLAEAGRPGYETGLAFEVVAAPPERLFERARREEPMWAAVLERLGARVD